MATLYKTKRKPLFAPPSTKGKVKYPPIAPDSDPRAVHFHLLILPEGAHDRWPTMYRLRKVTRTSVVLLKWYKGDRRWGKTQHRYSLGFLQKMTYATTADLIRLNWDNEALLDKYTQAQTTYPSFAALTAASAHHTPTLKVGALAYAYEAYTGVTPHIRD